MPVGIVVVAFVAVMSDSVGDGDDDDSDDWRERRRERRRHRRTVCRDIRRPLPPVSTPSVSRLPAESEPVLPPPNEDELGRALRRVESEIRACVPNAHGLLILDAALQGPTGTVRSFELEGEGRGPETRACLERVLADVRFEPFEGAMRVRWSINLSGEALPAPWSDSQYGSEDESE